MPGPVRQFVVIETLTVGFSGLFAVGGLVGLLGIGEDVTEAISRVAVSDAVTDGDSVISSVLV